MKYNPNDKVSKYIVIGRKTTVFNQDPNGEDRVKLISEIYRRKANSSVRGEFQDFERAYYREIGEGRGTDCGLEEGSIYPTMDGTLGNFVDLNFDSDTLESNEIKNVKTYPNQKFLKRNRKTSYHEEVNIGVDEDGNPVIFGDEEDDE